MSYVFLEGQACEPRRSFRRKRRSKSLISSVSDFRSTFRSSQNGFKRRYGHVAEGKGQTLNRDSESSSANEFEIDSGISLNLHYEPSTSPLYGMVNRSSIGLAEEEEAEAHLQDLNDRNDNVVDTISSRTQIIAALDKEPSSPCLSGSLAPSELEGIEETKEETNNTKLLKVFYREYYSEWFEPGAGVARTRHRSSRRKKLHQKLVLSQMNTQVATKLDMDDRAKMLQFFRRPRDRNQIESIRVED
eukprot:maker-scaffold1538_size36768-snap-gene-0.9 protein:Tk08903 transcript:maker-scaffold1538_size36768-snap-gene-0.9-mRNA-1 annotation:"serine threonine protein kinase"